MERIVSQIHKTLVKKKKSIAVAESCTGGFVSYMLTQLPLSSQYFILGVVAYSNNAKIKILKVPARLIAKKGVVSEEVAIKLAEGVRKLAKTDFGIGVTGIAGPSCGTTQKPVGTVFIALDAKNKKICKEFHFEGNRITVRRKASLKALELLKT